MIITKTPYRISFFGGGSDYPDWFNKYDGQVLSTTINKHIYITCRFLPKFFEHNYRIVWSKIENVKNLNQIQLCQTHWLDLHCNFFYHIIYEINNTFILILFLLFSCNIFIIFNYEIFYFIIRTFNNC